MVPRSMMMMVALVVTPLFRGHASEPVSFNFAPTPEPTAMAWDFTPSAPVVAAKPEPKVEPVVVEPVSLPVALGVSDPSLASPRWTYPGEIRNHLAQTHGVDAQGLSQAEAVDLHNRLHNAERRGVPIQEPTFVAQVQDCPGGVCPINTAPQVVRSRSVVVTRQDCPSGTCPTGPVRTVIQAAPVRRTVTAPVRYFRNNQPIRNFFRNGGFFRRSRCR